MYKVLPMPLHAYDSQARMQKNSNQQMEKQQERRNQRSSRDTQTLTNQPSNDEIEHSCPICFETFDNDRCRAAFTCCGHPFCENYLEKIMKLKPFCPLCRQHLQQDKSNDQHSEPIHLDQNTPWNPDVVRAFFGEELMDKEGRPMRTVHLSDGQRTNIHVGRNVKINISPGSNIIINGKRVQNPSACNQQ